MYLQFRHEKLDFSNFYTTATNASDNDLSMFCCKNEPMNVSLSPNVLSVTFNVQNQTFDDFFQTTDVSSATISDFINECFFFHDIWSALLCERLSDECFSCCVKICTARRPKLVRQFFLGDGLFSATDVFFGDGRFSPKTNDSHERFWQFSMSFDKSTAGFISRLRQRPLIGTWFCSFRRGSSCFRTLLSPCLVVTRQELF